MEILTVKSNLTTEIKWENNNMSYIIEFTSPVMKDKMYYHETRVLVDKPEKATKYETKEGLRALLIRLLN